MQNQLYYGKFGMEPTAKQRSLDPILNEHNCRIADINKCVNLVEDIEIGNFIHIIRNKTNSIIY